MKAIISVFGIGVASVAVLAACAPPSGQVSNHQNLDVEYCRKIAQETFASGKRNNNLCPGYMPTGEANELP